MAEDMQGYIDILSQQAIQLHQQGRYEQALKVVEETCSLANQHFGEEHPISLLCLNNLAMVQHALGNSAQTAEVLQHILVLQQVVLEEMHPDRAITLNNLASVHLEQARYGQAEPLLLEAIEIWQSMLDGPESNLASCLNNLAFLYDRQDQFDEAIPLYQQAIDIWSLLPEEKHHIATSLDNVGLCFLKKGDNAQAIEYFQAALEMRRTLLGEQHPDVAENLNELGLLLMGKGDYQQATLLYLQSLDIHQKISSTHLDSLKVLDNLATAYSRLGKYTEAENIYQRILESRRTLPGGEDNYPDLAKTLNGLASLWPDCIELWETTHKPEYITIKLWRYARDAWAKAILMLASASIISPCFIMTWMIPSKQSNFLAKRLRSHDSIREIAILMSQALWETLRRSSMKQESMCKPDRSLKSHWPSIKKYWGTTIQIQLLV